ncbi:MAG: hypothetical protein CFE44_20005 [Burkholderiales bacterium PBB4]|nr:MAG: hypothetical protein CFE44_20005 [Burkholderiales bacterium PBB4]
MHQGKVDEEMWFAFDKAMHLGTAEATVRLVLVEIACTQWSELNESRKKKVAHLLEITPVHHRGPIAAYIKATNCPATF